MLESAEDVGSVPFLHREEIYSWKLSELEIRSFLHCNADSKKSTSGMHVGQ